MERAITDEEIDYAYKVFDVLAKSMNKVVDSPDLAYEFVVKLIMKLPEIIDALMIVTVPEHRMAVAEMMKAAGRLAGTWARKIS